MLCIIAPEYESRDEEKRHRSADDTSGETDEAASDGDDPSDGDLLTARTV